MNKISLFGCTVTEQSSNTYYYEQDNIWKSYGENHKPELLNEQLYGHWAILYDIYKTCTSDYISWSTNGGNFSSEKPIDENNSFLKQNEINEYKSELVSKLENNKQVICLPQKLKQTDVEKVFSDQLFDSKCLKKCIDHIKKIFPKYHLTALRYLKSKELFEDKNFAFSRSFFQELCDFIFPILLAEKDTVTFDRFPTQKLNFLEVIGTFLFGVFIKYRCQSEKQMISFYNISNNKMYFSAPPHLAPAYSGDSIVVILSSSDLFSPYLGVCIKSIINTTSQCNNYDIIVFERGISQNNKDKILRLSAKSSNISIRFFNIASNMRSINFFVNSTRISQETYYGLLIPWFLPDYKKAIIMDCDMIVKQDLAELYHENLESYVAGGVRDVILQGWLNDSHNDTSEYYFDVLNAKDPFTYVNGGMLLLDFEKYRKTVSQELVLHYINNYKFRVVDQDIFNLLLEGKVRDLDAKWNHMIRVNGAISSAIDNAPYKSQEKYYNAKKDPGIIHYASENKPWKNPDLEFADEFWKVARETPFYESILSRMVQGNITVSDSVEFIDQRSGARKIADVLFPLGSRKRKLLKTLLPKGSLRWRFCKQIYYIFRPDYRPKKIEKS